VFNGERRIYHRRFVRGVAVFGKPPYARGTRRTFRLNAYYYGDTGGAPETSGIKGKSVSARARFSKRNVFAARTRRSDVHRRSRNDAVAHIFTRSMADHVSETIARFVNQPSDISRNRNARPLRIYNYSAFIYVRDIVGTRIDRFRLFIIYEVTKRPTTSTRVRSDNRIFA